MWKVYERVLTLTLLCLVGFVRSSANNKCHGLNDITGADQMYVHAQTVQDHGANVDFRLPSKLCAENSDTRGIMYNQREQNCQKSRVYQDISRNADVNEGVEIRDSPGATDGAQTQKCSNPSPSATFVTALYDIGRGNWAIFPRPYSVYLNYFKDVLKLNVNMVVIVADSDRKFVWSHRTEANMTNSTRVWTKPFEDLTFHKYIPEVRDIVESDDFRENNENLRHPEAFSPEYIILMNSKLSLLKEVAQVNPFCSSHFVWIDAGYGHGKNVLPLEGTTWVPRGLIDVHNKVTIIQLDRPILYEHYEKTALFKLGARPAFSGGFFGGDSGAINLLTALHKVLFESLLGERLVHEDQMMMLMCYFRRPDYFNPVEGGWYDGYNLFH